MRRCFVGFVDHGHGTLLDRLDQWTVFVDDSTVDDIRLDGQTLNGRIAWKQMDVRVLHKTRSLLRTVKLNVLPG